MRAWWLVVCLASCGDDGGSAVVDAPTVHDAPPDSPPDACVAGNPAAHVIYLHKGGGMYLTGGDDAGMNKTTILSADKTIPAPIVDATEWTNFVTCFTSKFAPFAVTITEVDPGTAPHMELVVIDNAQTIGFQQGVFGLAPYSCDTSMNGAVHDKSIAFLMWDAGVTERCQTGAQMVGNLFGLDHAFSCPDLMTYLGSCGPSDNKTFTDTDVPCGETSARTCSCGKATQNAFQTIAKTTGLSCH